MEQALSFSLNETNGVPFYKQIILEQAQMLFARRGFEGSGIEAIAQSVGIRKSVIYYHFRNKEQIPQTLLDEFVAAGMAFDKPESRKQLIEAFLWYFRERLLKNRRSV